MFSAITNGKLTIHEEYEEYRGYYIDEDNFILYRTAQRAKNAGEVNWDSLQPYAFDKTSSKFEQGLSVTANWLTTTGLFVTDDVMDLKVGYYGGNNGSELLFKIVKGLPYVRIGTAGEIVAKSYIRGESDNIPIDTTKADALASIKVNSNFPTIDVANSKVIVGQIKTYILATADKETPYNISIIREIDNNTIEFLGSSPYNGDHVVTTIPIGTLLKLDN